MTVYIGHLGAGAVLIARPLRLATIPATVTARTAVGDELLLGTGITRAEYGRLYPHLVDLPAAAFPFADFDWPEDPSPAGTSPPHTRAAAQPARGGLTPVLRTRTRSPEHRQPVRGGGAKRHQRAAPSQSRLFIPS